MTLSARTHSDAATELAEAVRWYESKRSGLGAELLDEVSHAIEEAREALRGLFAKEIRETVAGDGAEDEVESLLPQAHALFS